MCGRGDACRILIGNLKGAYHFGYLMLSLSNNIKMDHKETGYEDMY
jgi:hypothetical protein